jgi:hypothetical protein
MRKPIDERAAPMQLHQEPSPRSRHVVIVLDEQERDKRAAHTDHHALATYMTEALNPCQ